MLFRTVECAVCPATTLNRRHTINYRRPACSRRTDPRPAGAHRKYSWHDIVSRHRRCSARSSKCTRHGRANDADPSMTVRLRSVRPVGNNYMEGIRSVPATEPPPRARNQRWPRTIRLVMAANFEAHDASGIPSNSNRPMWSTRMCRNDSVRVR